MILTYKYRLKDKSAKRTLSKYAFSVNQVWNYCNEVQKKAEDNYRSGSRKRNWPSKYDLQVLTKGTSKELGIYACTTQLVCNQYAKARDKAKRSLKFRSSLGPKKSLGWVPIHNQETRSVNNSLVYCGKKFYWFGSKGRPLPKESIKDGCFVEDSQGKWYICFHVEVDQLPIGPGQVGIDLGLKTLATCSNGNKIDNLKFYRKQENRVVKAQRSRSKKKTRAIHAKIRNSRKDFLHKASCILAKENALIAVGNVSPSQLAKTRFAKSIYDASWSTFRNQLRYKASRHGATYLEVDEAFTTQACSECGALSGPKGIAGLGIRDWVCSHCGTYHDRDVNSARNILRLGQSTLPPAEGRLQDAA